MSAQRSPEMDDSASVSVTNYSPEYLRYKNGGAAYGGNIPRAANSACSSGSRMDHLQTVGKKAVEVTYVKKKKGRPSESGSVCVTPIFRNPPDFQKLGRAVLNLVEYLMEHERKEENHHAS